MDVFSSEALFHIKASRRHAVNLVYIQLLWEAGPGPRLNYHLFICLLRRKNTDSITQIGRLVNGFSKHGLKRGLGRWQPGRGSLVSPKQILSQAVPRVGSDTWGAETSSSLV